MSMVTVTIDGRSVQVAEGSTVLDAARKAGIDIPTLCAAPEINHTPGACRVCVVEIPGMKNLVASCVYPVSDGMVVKTSSPRARAARKANVELLLANHPADCNTCVRNGSCELQTVARKVGLRDLRFEGPDPATAPRQDTSSPAIIRDPAKCIKCYRCVTVCEQVQTPAVLAPAFRGDQVVVGTAFDLPLNETACVMCGQCIMACPVGAIYERDHIADVWAAIQDPDTHVVVQEAPAVRAALGEEFGMPPGSLVTGKMIAALRRLGFDRVFDTNFAADLTIMEEGTELLSRVKNGGVLPMITSCSPGWIKFCEHFYPELTPNLSTCKSPQQMFGAIAKTYYAEKAGIPAEKIVVVSIMPCTAKKFECQRAEMNGSGFQDVDYVLTTRELGRMVREAGIDFQQLADEDYDSPLGEYTGAATIFGATGGVMEAAIRTVYHVVTGADLGDLNITPVRGLEGVKEASLEVGDLGTVKVAVAHGLGNARKLMDRIQNKTADYHFIEIMACPGGCIAGGGQPIPTTDEIRRLRSDALYRDDAEVQQHRQSHENPSIQALYAEYLKEPLGHRSHELLHTHYVKRGNDLAPAEAAEE